MRPLRALSEDYARRAFPLDAVLSDGELGRMRERRLAAGDQRRAPRQRVMLSAMVAHSDFNISFRCAIHDLSEGGARIKAPPGVLIPDRSFLVHISGARGYAAEIAWRRYPHIGLSLGEAMDLREPVGPLARRLRSLWLGAIS